MSEPAKDNEHILSNRQAFREAYARARKFFEKIEGVVGVGFGLKETGGQYKDDIAIAVYVREKKKEEDLAPEQRIPPLFEGYRTDVRIVGRGGAEVCDNTTRYAKIQGGIQIMGKSDGGSYQGTLGCIVKKRNDRSRDNVYLLTNKHVLYSSEFGADEHVYHPTPGDENLGPVQGGALYGNYPYPIGDPLASPYFLDCAIARIDLDSKCWCCTCTKDTTEVEETLVVDLQVNGVNSLSDVRSVIDDPGIIHTAAHPVKVFKVGRTTGKTTGRVVAINASLDADPEPDKVGGPVIEAVGTIHIEFDVSSPPNCHGNQRFTEGGDSGSVIVDENNRVIGLHTHFGPPGPSGLIASHACHIVPVLDYLGICIPVTTGTSHGSSLATDGSGLAPGVAPLPIGDFPMPPGEIVFVNQAVEAAPARSPSFPEPVAVTDDEVRHMRGLLAEFRSTQTGRELHDVFGRVRREIGYLVRNCRPVKVAWHRNKGPAFLAHVLNHLKGQADQVPREVGGISSATLLTRLGDALSKYGSNPLREAIEKHSDDLLSMLTSGNGTVQDCIAYLQQKENA